MAETNEAPKALPAPARSRWALAALFFVLYLLHNDLWLWDDTRLVLGLPVGLLYHVVYCLVVSVALALLVGRVWPALDTADPAAAGRPEPPAGESGR